MMARVAAREGELALRTALGATRARLMRQSVSESLLLALGGAVIGVMLAAGSIRALLAFQPGNLPRVSEIHLSWDVLSFALSISVVAALAMGLLTAWRAGRGSLRGALAKAQRTQADGSGSMRVRRALVVVQVAATLVLLVGAGLLGRSFVKLLSVDLGFRTDHALVLDLALPYADDSATGRLTARFYDELIARLRVIPGVREVGGVTVLPLGGTSAGNGTFLITTDRAEKIDPAAFETLFRDHTRTGDAEYRVASGDYFRAVRIPLVRRRLFDDRDAPDAPHVAVISRSLAEKRWPGEDVIGKVIEFGNMDGDLRPFTIVGVVGDVLRLVLREGVMLAIAGVVIGGAAALALTRLIAGLLYGVSSLDPVSFPIVSAGLVAIALRASFLPPRRAARIDPVSALRGG